MFSNRPRESGRDRRHKSTRSAKDKKLSRLIASDSEGDDNSEHELSFYINDRVKMMKQVLKIMKPRKIKSMAPDCMKNMDLQEINSMLLEELLGISNKRLKYIFEGKTLDEESSTDEDQPIDVISLDDISDDDFVVISDEEADKRKGKHKRKKIKDEPKEKQKKVKKEKPDKEKGKGLESKEKSNGKEKEAIGEENLMSVLELLELQARARAIRSQLELESKKKQEEKAREEKVKLQSNRQDDDDEIIMEVPQDVEIIITSSDSDSDDGKAESNKSRHTTEQSSTSSPKHVNQDTNQSNIHTSSHDVPNNSKTKGQESKTCDYLDKEEGEVSDSEITSQNDHGTGGMGIIVDATSYSTVAPRENSPSLDSDDSESNSSDNLQVVMEREKRRRRRYRKNISKPAKTSRELEILSSKNLTLETAEINHESGISGQTEVGDKRNHLEDNMEKTNSKIEIAIQEFMQTQSPPPDNSEELKRLEQEKRVKEDKIKKEKERRLKGFKNKLQSFKQDVAVESSNVTVLENIIIKPKTAKNSIDRGKSLEHSDDLVINVDQEDLDCIVCD